MRARGIGYDTGFINAGTTTRESFAPVVVRREMEVIRHDLHCTAVRVVGGDPGRLETAAVCAAEAGLEVWFSPFTCDLSSDGLLSVLADCAVRAERLRRDGAAVVLVTGAELSLFGTGFLPGVVCTERLDLLLQRHPQTLRAIGSLPERINAFLAGAAGMVRARFGGPISYASIAMERVDWAPFDFAGFDAYRTAEIAAAYPEGIRAMVGQGKPVAITEFGCATYRGAAGRGAQAGMIVQWDGAHPVRLDGEYVRDEAEQAAEIRDVFAILVAGGVDSAFLHTFAAYHLPHRPGPRDDLDMAGYGVVKVLEAGTGRTHPGPGWEPKAAFAAVAAMYGA